MRLKPLTSKFFLPVATTAWVLTAHGQDQANTAAEHSAYEDCLVQQLHTSSNDNKSVIEIKEFCSRLNARAIVVETVDTEIEERADLSSFVTRPRSVFERFNQTPVGNTAFFKPYKDNYLSFGGMRNRDGSEAFSGETNDVKFQLGLKFALFESVSSLEFLAPLHVGYSQKSWWDIAESSAPFVEHNYNPEVFWDFTKYSQQQNPAAYFVNQLVNRIGFEHQSNGRDQESSRSWDRIYAQSEFHPHDRFSIRLKIWDIVNVGEENSDIVDYLGNGELSAAYQISDNFGIQLTTTKGRKTEKFNYQLDLITDFSLTNGRLFFSYYDGYNEALINYNKKSRSFRVGLLFPVNID